MVAWEHVRVGKCEECGMCGDDDVMYECVSSVGMCGDSGDVVMCERWDNMGGCKSGKEYEEGGGCGGKVVGRVEA